MMTKKLITRLLPLAGLLWVALLLPQTAMAADVFNGPHSALGDLCGECHDIRNASYPQFLGKLCQSCHYDSGPATSVKTHSSKTTDAGYGNWDLDCWACHNPHTQEQNESWGSTYGKYIKKDFGTSFTSELPTSIKEIDPNDPGPYYTNIGTIRTIPSDIVEFKGNTEFVDGDGLSEDDICQVCHESTVNFNGTTALNTHTNYGPDSQPGGNCTSECHLHTSGFVGGCQSCHQHEQANASAGGDRRLITSSGGDFERTSHHVTDGTAAEVVSSDDCQVCHNQADHQNQLGSNDDVAVLLNDADTGVATYTYNGIGNSLTPFCLSCHDADSSLAYDADGNPGDGQQPFSDGRTPPDIDTAWSSSAHYSYAVPSTYGCLTCHGGYDSTVSPAEAVTNRNIHGSATPKLISSRVAGINVTNTEEEGICYHCHDGAGPGPASSDIEPDFNTTTNFQVTAYSGAAVNQRHDILAADQAYSGGVVECANCHNPHTVNSFNKNSDPDTPTSSFTQTYAPTNVYARDGFNFAFKSQAAFVAGVCTHDGEGTYPSTDNCSGDYVYYPPGYSSSERTRMYTYGAFGGTEAKADAYVIEVTTGGVEGVAEVTVTSSITGDECNTPQTYTWEENHTTFSVCDNGLAIDLRDYASPPALYLGSEWTVATVLTGTDLNPMTPAGCDTATPAGPESCIGTPEPDMVTFCLVCHDGTAPDGVSLTVTTNIATSFSTNDQHGVISGNGSTQGYMKSPWQHVGGGGTPAGDDTDGDGWADQVASEAYAALQCTFCHDGHGSDNIFHLRTSINVRGVQMAVGAAPGAPGWTNDPFTPESDHGAGDTTYVLPCFDSGGTQVSCSTPGSTQKDRGFGAWCTFCHDLANHSHGSNSETDTCSSAHTHGSSRF